MNLDSILEYLEGYLSVSSHPDYPTALNGLQVDGPADIHRVAAAVDASQASIEAAVAAGADLLLVHHGLFWSGLEPLTGPLFRRTKALIEGDLGLYSCHLPLDAHPEVGNCALLARALGVDPEHRFGAYKGVEIGWWGALPEPEPLDALAARFGEVVGAPVHAIRGGRDPVQRIGVVTGGGASFTREAAALGLDVLVTGEGAHHTHFEAVERGIHVLLGGHYATETFGVRALAAHLEQRFDLPWTFIDQPTGL